MKKYGPILYTKCTKMYMAEREWKKNVFILSKKKKIIQMLNKSKQRHNTVSFFGHDAHFLLCYIRLHKTKIWNPVTFFWWHISALHPHPRAEISVKGNRANNRQVIFIFGSNKVPDLVAVLVSGRVQVAEKMSLEKDDFFTSSLTS